MKRIREDYSNGHYVYAHYTLDGRLFYFGKGIGFRYKDGRSGRGVAWHEATKNGFSWMILADHLTNDESVELEKFLIEEAKETGRYQLANGTKGGNKSWGNRPGKASHWYGKKHTETTKKKISETKRRNSRVDY